MIVTYCENVWICISHYDMIKPKWLTEDGRPRSKTTEHSYYPASMIQREARLCNLVVCIWYDDILTVFMLWPPGEGLEKDVLIISHQKNPPLLALKQLDNV